jgi:endonuclease YncB( thermonuclease family)
LHLQRLCTAGPLRIIPTRRWPDRYGRLIARVYDSNQRDLCSAMIVDGYAVQYRPKRRNPRAH